MTANIELPEKISGIGQKRTLVRVMLREEISKVVIERILDGTYPPGSRIVESKLAREFGTSQAPAREAMRDLEGMNLVESLPHKGVRVRKIDPERLRQVYPVRSALEEMAGREAAPKMTDEIISSLEVVLNSMRKAADENDIHAVLGYDTRFHEIIIETAGNEVLLDMWHSLHVESRMFVNVKKGDWDLQMIVEQHVPLVEIMKTRDPKSVSELMRAHIEYFGSLILNDAEVVDAGSSDDHC